MTARDISMTTRSTRGAVPLALAFATLACVWLADARPAAAAPAGASVVAAASAASAPASAATQYAVKPGQSLADIAASATQSHDKAVISRAAKAIFDANPSAFMRSDPSLLKLGAVLNVPPLDATGAVVRSEAAPSAASGSASGAASATAALASPPAAAAKPNGVQAGNPASVSSAASASSAPASSPAASQASSVGAVASAPAKAAAPAAVHAQPGVPAGASGEHAWSGAIETAPVAPASATAEGAASAVPASGATAPAAPAASTGQGASTASSAAGASAAVAGATSGTRVAEGAASAAAASAAAAHPKVSSLQQLLTLKNRVLMELQRHGFGTPAPARPGAAGSAPASAAGFAVAPAASGVVAPAPGRSRAAAAANQRFIGIGGIGFGVSRDDVPALAATAAAVVAALVVLLGALGISRRKRRKTAAAHKAAGPVAPGAAAATGDESAAPMTRPAAAVDDPIEAELLAILARNPSSKRALMGLAARYAERQNVSGFDEIAQRIYRLSGGRGPNWIHVAALGRQLDPDNPLYALEAGEADDAVATGSPSGDAPNAPAQEAGAPSAAAVGHAPSDTTLPGLTGELPQTPPATEPGLPSEAQPDGAAHVAKPLQPEPEPGADVAPTAEAASLGAAPHLAEPHGAEPDEGGPHEAEVPEAEEHKAEQHEAETREAESPDAVSPEAESTTPGRPEATLPPEAIAALGDLDLGLPPRIEDADSAAQPAAATPSEASESQHEHEFSDLAPAHEAHAELPAHVEPGEDMGPESKPTPAEPEARPSVAGLGAAPIGPLRLSFDLDLPGGEAGERDGSIAASAPLPEFTPEQLAKIARNKLELAAEYIALGDLGGARTLINEVIESNDVATRDEAHALLATLAPLS